MPPLYKVSVYLLVLLAITAIVYGIMVPIVGAVPAMGMFGLLGLSGFSPFFFRKGKQTVLTDERDADIAGKANLLAYSIFWIVFVLGSMATWAILRFGKDQSTVSVEVFPSMVVFSFVVFITIRSLTTVILYHHQNDAKK